MLSIPPSSPSIFSRSSLRLFGGSGLLLIGLALRLIVPPIGFLGLLFAATGVALLAYELLVRVAARGESRLSRTAVLAAKLARVLAVLALAAFIAAEIYVVTGAGGSPPERSGDADYLIVLGTQVNGLTPSLMLSSRLEAALDYLEQNPETVAVLSGGQGPGEDTTEAHAMRSWLERHGISPDRLIEEPASSDTIQNIRNSLEIIASTGSSDLSDTKICVLSNEFHLRRASLIASLEGCKVETFPAATPRADLAVCYFAREVFSLAKVFLSYALG